MNENKMNARMMAVMNDLAKNADNAAYVKETAEDFLGDLFCDYLKNGARAMFCMTDKGPAYILDTEYGSYSVPFVVLNKKLAAALNSPASTMIEDEKKKRINDVTDNTSIVDEPDDFIDVDGNCENTFSDIKAGAAETVHYDNAMPQEEAAHFVAPKNEVNVNDDVLSDTNDVKTESELTTENNAVNGEAQMPEETDIYKDLQPEETNTHSDVPDVGETETVSFEKNTPEESTTFNDTANNIASFKEELAADDDFTDDDEENERYMPSFEISSSEKMQTGVSHQADSQVSIESNDNQANEEHVNNDDANDMPVADAVATPPAPKKKGFFGFGRHQQETVNATPSETAQPTHTVKKFAGIGEALTHPGENTFKFKDDKGELFKHTHNLTVTMKYNTDAIVGKYKVEFWPTWLQMGMGANGQTYAECLVRISDDKGTEMIAITDRTNKEFSYKFHGTAYTFKMVGVWDSGMLTTHVSIDNDSKYKLIDDFKREEPKHLTSNFLEQFESIERGQPQYFIVPLRADNRGEAKIPIIGIVKDGNNKYILARLNDNTCQYTHNNKTREISGHWENGRFHISII